MDKEELYKGSDDIRRIVSSDDSYNKFNVLRKYAEKLKKDICNNKECYNYILKEVIKENENIKGLLIWNQKRIDLLNEVNNKINVLVDKMSDINNEMFDIIFEDVENFKTQKD